MTIINQADTLASQIDDMQRRLAALESSPASGLQFLASTGDVGSMPLAGGGTSWTPVTANGSNGVSSQVSFTTTSPCRVFVLAQAGFYLWSNGATHANFVYLRSQIASDPNNLHSMLGFIGTTGYGDFCRSTLFTLLVPGTYTAQFAYRFDVPTTDEIGMGSTVVSSGVQIDVLQIN